MEVNFASTWRVIPVRIRGLSPWLYSKSPKNRVVGPLPNGDWIPRVAMALLKTSIQKKYNTPRYRTPQAIFLANYERNPIIACW